jgi:hypothetical protein
MFKSIVKTQKRGVESGINLIVMTFLETFFLLTSSLSVHGCSDKPPDVTDEEATGGILDHELYHDAEPGYKLFGSEHLLKTTAHFLPIHSETHFYILKSQDPSNRFKIICDTSVDPPLLWVYKYI